MNTYESSTSGDRFVVPNENLEHAIRPAVSVAVGLAVAIETGLVDDYRHIIGASKNDLILQTKKIIKGIASIHKSNGGMWGDHWQSSLWAGLLGRAGWMLWKELDDETKEMVLSVVIHEADRHISNKYVVPYWNGVGGDSEAEENSWEAMVLQLAVTMLPHHPHACRWKKVCSELQISALARESDMVRTAPILDGKSPKEWLNGYNIREDGIVINHNRIHNDYMVSVAHLQMQGFLVCSLADVPVPETVDFNFDVIYHALATKQFPSPPYDPPGGTMYIPGSPEQYYPQGTDWSRHRFVCFLLMDTYADLLEYDKGLPYRAEQWWKLRAEKILEMQSRHRDGHMYAKNEFDSYPGREHMALWMFGDAYLLRWISEHGALSGKGNRLAGCPGADE